jgi:hypothetical protein
MQQKLPLFIKGVIQNNKTPIVISLILGLLIVVQGIRFAHSMPTILDEGTYLNKGYWFMIGKYIPYQDYGPWTNHMPFSFLIPGAAQAWIGPGLRTGRYFAIFMTALLALGVWLAGYRVSNRWGALLMVAVIALNPTMIWVYTLAVSQSLTAALFVWSIALILDKNRRFWQLVLSALLAVLLFMTRINITPLLPALLLYILWRDGWKTGVKVTLAAALMLFFLNALYWPGILRVYYRGLYLLFANNASLLGFFGDFAPPAAESTYWSLSPSANTLWFAFWQGFRLNYLYLVMGFFAPILLALQKPARSDARFKTSVLFGGLFLFLLFIHGYSSLAGDYCIFCFQGYIPFFSFLGGLWFLLHLWSGVFPSWRWGDWSMPYILIALSTGIGFGSKDFLNREIITPLNTQVFYTLLRVPAPGGWQRVFTWVSNTYILDHSDTLEVLFAFSRQIGPVFLGLIFGTAVLLFGFVIVLAYRKFQGEAKYGDLGYALMSSMLVLGAFLSPTAVMNQPVSEIPCGDVIAAQEKIAQQLNPLIPDGAWVYWGGYKSAVPLLYLSSRIELFPAQVNGVYNFLYGADPDALDRYGLWGPELAKQWLSESDYALVNDTKSTMDHAPDYWEIVEVLPPQDTCSDEGRLVLWVNTSRVQP